MSVSYFYFTVGITVYHRENCDFDNEDIQAVGKVYLFNLLTSEDEPIWAVTGQNELDQLGYEIDFIIGNTGENTIVVSAPTAGKAFLGCQCDQSVHYNTFTFHKAHLKTCLLDILLCLLSRWRRNIKPAWKSDFVSFVPFK